MPVLLRRPTFNALTDRAHEADAWKAQADASAKDAARVLDAVDVSMRALSVLHVQDMQDGTCIADGKPYPCPTGDAVAAIVAIWDPKNP